MEDRGTGITTKQIQAAPEGAWYVWVHQDTSYPASLARKLGRTDLKIVGPGMLDRRHLAGRDLTIVVDHAARLSADQFEALAVFANRKRKDA